MTKEIGISEGDFLDTVVRWDSEGHRKLVREALSAAVDIQAERLPARQAGPRRLINLLYAVDADGNRTFITQTPPYEYPPAAVRERLGAEIYNERYRQARDGHKAETEHWINELKSLISMERSVAPNQSQRLAYVASDTDCYNIEDTAWFHSLMRKQFQTR